MDQTLRTLACFHCGCEDKLRPHEQCDCDSEGVVHTPEQGAVACLDCDYHCCGDCYEFLNPICTEKEGLDHERN